MKTSKSIVDLNNIIENNNKKLQNTHLGKILTKSTRSKSCPKYFVFNYNNLKK